VRALACAWLVCASALAQDLAPIPKLDNPVVDTTGTLDATQKATLEQQARALQQRKGSQLQVLMVPTTQPETIEQYTVRAFEQYKLGRKGVDDGVLVVVAKDDHRVRIEPGYGLEGAIPDAIANRIIQEYLVPKFRGGDYGGGLIDGTAAIVKLIDGEPLPAPMADNAPSAIAAAAAIGSSRSSSPSWSPTSRAACCASCRRACAASWAARRPAASRGCCRRSCSSAGSARCSGSSSACPRRPAGAMHAMAAGAAAGSVAADSAAVASVAVAAAGRAAAA
jgi:uncharacterized membrane protein YgcG